MSTFVNKVENLMNGYYKSLDNIAELKTELDSNKDKYAVSFYNEQLEDIKQKQAAITQDTKDKFKVIREEFQNKFNEWATLKAEDMDHLRLLDGTIQVTREDMELIGQKHPNNYTIQRALTDYGRKNDIQYYAKVRKENIVEGLQFVDAQIRRAFEDSSGYSAILFKQTDVYSNLRDIFNAVEEG